MDNYEYLIDTLGKDEDIQTDLLKRLGVATNIVATIIKNAEDDNERCKTRYKTLMSSQLEIDVKEMEMLSRQVGFNNDLIKKLKLIDDGLSGNTSHDMERKVRIKK